MPKNRTTSSSKGSTKRGSSAAGASRTRPGETSASRRSTSGTSERRPSRTTRGMKGKTIQEETEIGEDYESGRRDALP